jgi:hypothetical protein
MENKPAFWSSERFYPNVTLFGILGYVIGIGLIVFSYSESKNYINNIYVLVCIFLPVLIIMPIGWLILKKMSFFEKSDKIIINGFAIFYFLPISLLPYAALSTDNLFHKDEMGIEAIIYNKFIYNHHVPRGGTYEHHAVVFKTKEDEITTDVMVAFYNSVSLGSKTKINIRKGCFGFKKVIN